MWEQVGAGPGARLPAHEVPGSGEGADGDQASEGPCCCQPQPRVPVGSDAGLREPQGRSHTLALPVPWGTGDTGPDWGLEGPHAQEQGAETRGSKSGHCCPTCLVGRHLGSHARVAGGGLQAPHRGRDTDFRCKHFSPYISGCRRAVAAGRVPGTGPGRRCSFLGRERPRSCWHGDSRLPLSCFRFLLCFFETQKTMSENPGKLGAMFPSHQLSHNYSRVVFASRVVFSTEANSPSDKVHDLQPSCESDGVRHRGPRTPLRTRDAVVPGKPAGPLWWRGRSPAVRSSRGGIAKTPRGLVSVREFITEAAEWRSPSA